MQICGLSIPGTSCFNASVNSKDIAIALVAFAAIGLMTAGFFQLGGIVQLGLLGNYGGVFLACTGGGVFAIDLFLAMTLRYCSCDKLKEEDSEEILESSSKEALDQLKTCQEEWKNLEMSDQTQVNSFIENLKELENQINALDSSDRKINRSFINAVLKLKITIKQALNSKKKIDSEEVAKNLLNTMRSLRATALNYYFKDKIEEQREFFQRIKECFDSNKNFFKENLSNNYKFVKRQVKRWESKLEAGKPISLPKWFHSTHHPNTLEKIGNDIIKVMRVSGFLGAFVSNQPEVKTYGNYGFTLSSQIERKVVKGLKSNDTIAIQTMYSGMKNVLFADSLPVDFDVNDISDKQDEVQVWLGFQKPIPIKRRIKQIDPIGYYQNITVGYIYHTDGCAEYCEPSSRSGGRKPGDGPPQKDHVEQVKNFALVYGVPCVTYDEIMALRQLINTAYPLVIPQDWKSRIN